MLGRINEIGVFDRSDGIDPFLILDGHSSRFQLPFLDYILDPAHCWTVCIGVPYGTSYYQVGDSSTEQNGCYKMALSTQKKKLLTEKANARLGFAIDKTDVVYLVGKAWEDSFARKDTNCKAISERGWGPLTYNVLLHKEIQDTKPRSNLETDNRVAMDPVAIPAVNPGYLNLTEGFAGTLVDRIVMYRNRVSARTGEDMDNQARQRMEVAQERINSGKTYSAGLHFAAGNVAIGSDVHRIQRDRKRKAEEEQSEKDRVNRDKFNKAYSKVLEVRALGKEPEQWNCEQLRTMVNWLKRKEDGPFLNKKQDLLNRYNLIKTRGEPQFGVPATLPLQPPPLPPAQPPLGPVKVP